MWAVATISPWAGAAHSWQLATLCIAPLTEEIVFRAGLHEALLRRPRGADARCFAGISRANALTAAAFAAAHIALHPTLLAALTALPALAVGSLYERTRRLWPCVLLHASFNAAWLMGSTTSLAAAPFTGTP